MNLFNSTNSEGSSNEGGQPFITSSNRFFIKIGIVVLALVVTFAVLSVARSIYTNWLWFDQLEYLNVFTTVLTLRIWLFFAGLAIFLPFIAINLYVAYKLSKGPSTLPVPTNVYKLLKKAAVAAVVLIALIISIVFGVLVSNRWETFILYFNQVPFNQTDPQFVKDISFYITTLPTLHFIQGWILGAIIATIAALAAFYGMMFTLRGLSISLNYRILGHLSVLGIFLMLTIAMGHFLDVYELVFSDSGAAPGAAYTDVHTRIPILYLLGSIALLAAVGFGASRFIGGTRLMVGAFSLWAVMALLVGALFPTSYQRIRVAPNELTLEKEFITRNIESTRAAYGIDSMEERDFQYEPRLTQKDLDDNPLTIKNVRLWDPGPLKATYNQIQFFELYYNFVDADVDRYTINDEYRQVMLSARELFPQNLDEADQNWVNQKLQYTHGFGATASPVTEFTTEGRPLFLLKDIPPKGDLPLTRPEIYYGENTTEFVIVNSKTEEFDHQPPGGNPQYKNYQGTGDVELSSFVRRLSYAWEFRDLNILISGQITPESRILYKREIVERVSSIVPFLKLDKDPYLVVAEEKLWWMLDGYTTTDRYPYSTRSGQDILGEDVNYIRNSVKILVDAYNGSVNFFVIDTIDPMIKMYAKAFPTLFKPFSSMPESLQDHIRYPIDYFSVQAEINLKYHMTDPNVFFNKQDQWSIGDEVFFDKTQPVKPYYVIMTLPGETTEEFVLILPFTPLVGEKMVSWMVARSDNENYGGLITFTFPRGVQVDGPEQVEARITSDEDLGREFTLLCPEGKLCIRGNLLVIPIGNSIMYVEPLFIRPQALDFPELKKVIVADATRVVMADTLSEGLALLLSNGDSSGVVQLSDDSNSTGTSPSKTGTEPTDKEIEQIISGIKGTISALEDALAELEQAVKGGDLE